MLRTLSQILRMPRVSIDLMLRNAAENDPFYERITRDFFNEATRPHPRLRIIKAMTWGVALLLLPRRFDDYFMLIEASARRNYKKALRNGCTFRRLDYNAHLSEIAAIRASAPVRQGHMSEEFLRGEVTPSRNPPSLSPFHDYPYFGVFKDERLVAYAGCAVYGELGIIEHIYGHADYQELGVTPMLIIKIAETLIQDHPDVRYYGFGTFFGAGKALQRFKRKLGFTPHRVDWTLDADPTAWQIQYVFRKVCDRVAPQAEPEAAQFVFIDSPGSAWRYRTRLRERWGWGGVVKTLLKTAGKRRALYGMIVDDRLLHTGWLAFGFCRYYAVEPNAVVVGPIWTDPAARGRGLASAALGCVMQRMWRDSKSILYIDTTPDNRACLKVIDKCGFGVPVGERRGGRP